MDTFTFPNVRVENLIANNIYGCTLYINTKMYYCTIVILLLGIPKLMEQ